MNCNEVVKILDLVLDCQATENQKKEFFIHVEKCVDCLDHFQLDKLFKEFVQKHEAKTCCPPSLIDAIKNQIKELPS